MAGAVRFGGLGGGGKELTTHLEEVLKKKLILLVDIQETARLAGPMLS